MLGRVQRDVEREARNAGNARLASGQPNHGGVGLEAVPDLLVGRVARRQSPVKVDPDTAGGRPKGPRLRVLNAGDVIDPELITDPGIAEPTQHVARRLEVIRPDQKIDVEITAAFPGAVQQPAEGRPFEQQRVDAGLRERAEDLARRAIEVVAPRDPARARDELLECPNVHAAIRRTLPPRAPPRGGGR